MKIAVIAAHGKTGRAFVKAALAAGHDVRAGIRGENPFEPHEKLETVHCNALNERDVSALLQNCEAAVCLIGHGKKSPENLQTDAIKNVHAAMLKNDIQRLVSLTGTGARIAEDQSNAIDKVMNWTIAKIDPARIADGAAHIAYLQTTDIDWTVIRVLKLTDGAAKTPQLSSHGPAKTFTSRATVARAIMLVLEENSFVKSAPIL